MTTMTKSIRVTYLVLATSNTKWTSKKKFKNISLSKTLNMVVLTSGLKINRYMSWLTNYFWQRSLPTLHEPTGKTSYCRFPVSDSLFSYFIKWVKVRTKSFLSILTLPYIRNRHFISIWKVACTIVGTKHSQTINVSVGDAPLILIIDNALCNNIWN